MIDETSPIEDLGLKQRTLHAIKLLGIVSISQLLDYSESALVKANISTLQCRDIRDSLSLLRLGLVPPSESPETAPLREYAPKAFPPVDVVKADPTSASFRDSNAMLERLFGSIPVPPADDDMDLDFSPRLFGSESAEKSERKKHGDDDRAERFAKRRSAKAARRDEPKDTTRVESLKQSYTMDAPDAAWLLGISVDLVYDGCAAGTIPNIHIGKRYKILTAKLFQMLSPSGVD